MARRRPTLLVVVPAKNEEEYLPRVLDSLVSNVEDANGIVETYVVVVDDGSTDRTPVIAEQYSRERSYILYLSLRHGAPRDPSIGLVRAVRAGLRYASAMGIEWDFFMQVDADTILLKGYIRSIAEVMVSRNDIGIAGGVTVNEPHSPLHIRNTGMAIRSTVWRQCRGYKPFPSPDTLIQLCSIAHSWKIAVVRNAKMLLLRPTRLNYYRAGLVDSVTGTSAFYALGKAARVVARLGVRETVQYLAGYLRGRLYRSRYPEIAELQRARRILEAYAIRSILAGLSSRRATRGAP